MTAAEIRDLRANDRVLVIVPWRGRDRISPATVRGFSKAGDRVRLQIDGRRTVASIRIADVVGRVQ